MMSRKGFELAAGTLVVMILGVLIVSMGLVLVWNIVSEGGDVAATLTSSQQAELDQLLSSGKLVAVTPVQATIRPGGEGVVGVGIENILDADAQFTVDIAGVDSKNVPLPLVINGPAQVGAWQARYFRTLDVKIGERETLAIILVPPKDAPSGSYTFLIKAMHENKVYDSPRILTVSVP